MRTVVIIILLSYQRKRKRRRRKNGTGCFVELSQVKCEVTVGEVRWCVGYSRARRKEEGEERKKKKRYVSSFAGASMIV